MPRFSDYQQGDKGQGVKDLQSNLGKVGYPLVVDGIFGPMTSAAVEHFQTSRGVSGDPAGVAGPGTLIELSQAIAQGWTQTDFIYLGKATVRDVKPPPSSAALATALPFDLSPTKIAVVGVIGYLAYQSSQPSRGRRRR